MEEALKTRRAEIMSHYINEIKQAIIRNKIKGEKPSKTFIYERLADFTYYSEVSIRKFLTGMLPKDVASFVEGVVLYSKVVQLSEVEIDNFVKEYMEAANAVVIERVNKKRTKNNLIPQDLTLITRTHKLTAFLDNFLEKEVNIAYIYGYKLSGKTKSVMAYMNDLLPKGKWENIIWIQPKQHQVKEVWEELVTFWEEETENLEVRKQIIKNLKQEKSILIVDCANEALKEETQELVKELSCFSKIVVLSSEPFEKLSENFKEYTYSFSMYHFMEEKEFYEMLEKNHSYQLVLQSNSDFKTNFYRLTGGIPFIANYILKKIVEENKLGITLDKAIEEYSGYEEEKYEDLAKKIIEDSWKVQSPLAKKILIFCSQFKCSVSSEFVAYFCGVSMQSEEWRNAMKECFHKELVTPVILNHPRLSMNTIIRILINTKKKEINWDEKEFLEKIASYYQNVAEDIGECYNHLEKMKRLDELDEWNVVQEVLDRLYNNQMNKEYVVIVRNLKYYLYVRGYWQKGENSIPVRRIELAEKLQDKNEELEALCDYINNMSKSKNKEIVEPYLERATRMVEKNKEILSRRIVCLYYHVKGLYLYYCLQRYQEAYELWEYCRIHYEKDVNEYRRLVMDLWSARCFLKINTNLDENIMLLETRIEETKIVNFVRAQIDYELLLIEVLYQKYEATQDAVYLERASQLLEECEMLFESKSEKDRRNEAFYDRLKANFYQYQRKEDLAKEYFIKAYDMYDRMNCIEDKKQVEESLNSLGKI